MKKLLFIALLTSIVLVGCAKSEDPAPTTPAPAAGTPGTPDAEAATPTEAK